MKKKIIVIASIVLVAVIVLGLAFRDNLTRGYVSLFQNKLEAYAVDMLDSEQTTGNYGAWETTCYPEEGMVEFLTGGWGVAPSTTYKGFYYSADDTHKAFSGIRATMEVDGDKAIWTDGTDNHGTSVRIAENWFWYEASF